MFDLWNEINSVREDQKQEAQTKKMIANGIDPETGRPPYGDDLRDDELTNELLDIEFGD